MCLYFSPSFFFFFYRVVRLGSENMRFKKGSKVEVLNKREDPAGSWWCAEIISGNGHYYYVRYDRNLPDFDSSVERVPRRAIRPCPPSEKGRLDWVPGDIVEVLNNFSWILAKIVMFSGGESFSVRILSSSKELIVHSSCIRLRKSWQDNKWIVFQKVISWILSLILLPLIFFFIFWKENMLSPYLFFFCKRVVIVHLSEYNDSSW